MRIEARAASRCLPSKGKVVKGRMEQSARRKQKGQPFRKQRAAERRIYEAEQSAKTDTEMIISCDENRSGSGQRQDVLDWLANGGNRDGFDPPAAVVQFLEDHGVKKLSHKKAKVPWALWWCHLCDHHLKDVSKAVDHLETKRHNLQVK